MSSIFPGEGSTEGGGWVNSFHAVASEPASQDEGVVDPTEGLGISERPGAFFPVACPAEQACATTGPQQAEGGPSDEPRFNGAVRRNKGGSLGKSDFSVDPLIPHTPRTGL